MQDFRLYVILDVDVCSQYGDIAEIARQTISGGADILQLRAKNISDRQILKIVGNLKDLTHKSKTPSILNDRADLVRIAGANGVHLGQGDLPVKEARKILGKNKIIGLSTHSVEEAVAAEKQGADYIGIGAIFPTDTKPAAPVLTPEIIAKVKDKVKVPFVAIGGINLDNLDQVLSCGAQRVAVCRAIVGAKDVLAVTKEFRRRLYN